MHTLTVVPGCSEVAKFCQKYLAAEITRLEKYHQGNLPDSLIEVSKALYPGLENLTVLLLRHAQRRSLKGGAGMGPLLNGYLRMQVFHRMDSMLKDTNYTAELDALRRNAHETAAADMQVGATNHTENAEEDGQVSTSESLDMLRQVGSCQLHSSLLSSHTGDDLTMVQIARSGCLRKETV